MRNNVLRAVAQELRDGDIVNLGSVYPQWSRQLFTGGYSYHSAIGKRLLGLGGHDAHPDLVNAGGQPCGVFTRCSHV